MEERLPCDTHREQIKTLYEKDLTTNKRIDGMGNLLEVVHNLDKNMALQTQMMLHMVERNDRQDKRMDDNDNIMVKVNENLTELAEGQKYLNLGNKQRDSEFIILKNKIDQNEDKHSIDVRDLDKERFKSILKKWGEPMAVISALGILLMKFIEIIKG